MQIELHLHHHPYSQKSYKNASAEAVSIDLKSALKKGAFKRVSKSYGLECSSTFS